MQFGLPASSVQGSLPFISIYFKKPAFDVSETDKFCSNKTKGLNVVSISNEILNVKTQYIIHSNLTLCASSFSTIKAL